LFQDSSLKFVAQSFTKVTQSFLFQDSSLEFVAQSFTKFTQSFTEFFNSIVLRELHRDVSLCY